MSEELKDLQDLDAEKQEKVKALLEKDAKSMRSSQGFWKIVTSLLGAFLVLFYFYAAGIATVGTQYHLGVYVFITYVLVFLKYPPGTDRVRIGLNILLGAFISCALAILLFYEDVAAFHAHMMRIDDMWSDEGSSRPFSSTVSCGG
jgi:TRAP-type uncharacterized transport system fused permease subunit